MASPSQRSRNNVRAGVFVTLTLMLAMTVLFVLSDVKSRLFQPSPEVYHVLFDVELGVGYLKPGSVVRVGGVAMGKVLRVDPLFEENRPLELIEVELELPRGVELYGNARVLVASSLLGNESWIEIDSVGNPRSPLSEGQKLHGVSRGMLGTMLGGSGAENVTEMLAGAREIAHRLSIDGGLLSWALGAQGAGDMQSMLQDGRAAAGNFRSLSSDVLAKWSDWSESVGLGLDRFRSVAQATDEWVLATSPRASEIVENVATASRDARDLAAQVRTESFPKFTGILDAAQDNLTSARDVIAQVQGRLPLWSASLEDAMADAALTAQQLKLTARELRASPWKLLYRPSDRELEHELLYESTRNFAYAAADLESSANSLRLLMEVRGDVLDAQDPAYRMIEEHLLENLQKHRKAQQQLFDVLNIDVEPSTDDGP